MRIQYLKTTVRLRTIQRWTFTESLTYNTWPHGLLSQTLSGLGKNGRKENNLNVLSNHLRIIDVFFLLVFKKSNGKEDEIS